MFTRANIEKNDGCNHMRCTKVRVCAYVCIHLCVCVCVFMYVCMYVCMYVGMTGIIFCVLLNYCCDSVVSASMISVGCAWTPGVSTARPLGATLSATDTRRLIKSMIC